MKDSIVSCVDDYWLKCNYPDYQTRFYAEGKPPWSKEIYSSLAGSLESRTLVRERKRKYECDAAAAKQKYDHDLESCVCCCHSKEQATPVGASYDFCNVDKNGNLSFGSVDGNYASGYDLSPIWFSEDTYRGKLTEKLCKIKENNNEFYHNICIMVKNNSSKTSDVVKEVLCGLGSI